MEAAGTLANMALALTVSALAIIEESPSDVTAQFEAWRLVMGDHHRAFMRMLDQLNDPALLVAMVRTARCMSGPEGAVSIRSVPKARDVLSAHASALRRAVGEFDQVCAERIDWLGQD